MKILVEDNFFDDPDLIRNLGLSHKSYKVNNNLMLSPTNGWKGQRSTPLSEMNNNILNHYSKLIFDLCYEFFDLDNFSFLDNPSIPYVENAKFIMTSYFHITTEETKSAFADWQDRYHRDPYAAAAGIVYLTPNAPLNAGTSFLDAYENQIINIENNYNRFVAYRGKIVHALSDVFGDSIETGRMTYTFFIDVIEDD